MIHDRIKKGYPVFPKTTGEHIRRWRIDNGLTQVQAIHHIGTCEQTIHAWEVGKRKVEARWLPILTKILGYDPSLNSQPK